MSATAQHFSATWRLTRHRNACVVSQSGAPFHSCTICATMILYNGTVMTRTLLGTMLRFKYVELWFSSHLADAWEIRHSGSGSRQE
jgi:hypothetical protein